MKNERVVFLLSQGLWLIWGWVMCLAAPFMSETVSASYMKQRVLTKKKFCLMEVYLRNDP